MLRTRLTASEAKQKWQEAKGTPAVFTACKLPAVVRFQSPKEVRFHDGH